MRVFDENIAVAIGLEEAIVVKQIEYWLKVNEKAGANKKDGHYWVYNSIAEWHEQFPFWSFSTVKRIFQSLRDKEILITAKYNRMKNDKSLWYRIDYEALESNIKVKLTQSHEVNLTLSGDTKLTSYDERGEPEVQNDPIEKVKLNLPLGQIDPIRKGQNEPTNTKERIHKEYTKKGDEVLTESLFNSLLGIWKRQYLMKLGKEAEPTEEEMTLLNTLAENGVNEIDFQRQVKDYFAKKRPRYSLGNMMESA
jgi:hypothetical protein